MGDIAEYTLECYSEDDDDDAMSPLSADQFFDLGEAELRDQAATSGDAMIRSIANFKAPLSRNQMWTLAYWLADAQYS